jgi:hypothetical protein
METAGRVKGLRYFVTNGLYHNALRYKTSEVVKHLFELRDDTLG